MASKKGQGSSENGRNSPGQRLGVKAFGGQFVTCGSILVRQRGTKWVPGRNVKVAKDDSIFAMLDGIVTYGIRHGRTTVSVLPPPPATS